MIGFQFSPHILLPFRYSTGLNSIQFNRIFSLKGRATKYVSTLTKVQNRVQNQILRYPIVTTLPQNRNVWIDSMTRCWLTVDAEPFPWESRRCEHTVTIKSYLLVPPKGFSASALCNRDGEGITLKNISFRTNFKNICSNTLLHISLQYHGFEQSYRFIGVMANLELYKTCMNLF